MLGTVIVMPSPTPMDLYYPGLFRLSGFGGAALFLRSGLVNGGQRRAGERCACPRQAPEYWWSKKKLRRMCNKKLIKLLSTLHWKNEHHKADVRV